MAEKYWIRVGDRFVTGYSDRHESVTLSAESALTFASLRHARRFIREHLDRGRGLYTGHFEVMLAEVEMATREVPTHDQAAADLPQLAGLVAYTEDDEGPQSAWPRRN
jgi:hypothetical protein